MLGYFVGLGFAAVYAKAWIDLAEDTNTSYFTYSGAALLISSLVSFVALLWFILGLISLVLFFVAVNEAKKELTRAMYRPRESGGEAFNPSTS